MTGFVPRTDNDEFVQLLQLAHEFQVPMLIHVDSGNAEKFLEICQQWPKVQILFAHAGGNLYPTHVQKILESCANVLVEFSARDPWRYGGLTDDTGVLLPEWRELVVAYPDRFAIGTDPVWRVTRTQSWDQADDGWDYFEQVLDYHHQWLNDLPVSAQRAVRSENARMFFNKKE